jgi:SAM-dependent methyltransferase
MDIVYETRNGIRFRHLKACPACSSAKMKYILQDGMDFETALGTYAVLECGDCLLQFTVPQPLPEDVHLLYSSRSSHDFENSSSFVSYLRRYNNFRQLKRLPQHLFEGNPICLDYGCGAGFFTQSMRAYLPGRIIGSDFHAEPPPLIRASPTIEYMADSSLASLKGMLDLIVCRNVLEHTVDPPAVLARLRALLKEGGAILIEVPNRNSTWTRLLGRYNFNYYLPRHLYHYDEHSLAKQLGGFQIIGRWFDHSPILGKSFGSMVGARISGFALAGLLLLPLQVLFDAPAGRSSQLVVVALRI